MTLPAERVVRVLENLLLWQAAPKEIRMDNGPEFISKRLKNWAREKQIELMHIQPGKPAQNAYIERFNRTFREDVLDAYLFDDLDEVRLIAEHWLEYWFLKSSISLERANFFKHEILHRAISQPSHNYYFFSFSCSQVINFSRCS